VPEDECRKQLGTNDPFDRTGSFCAFASHASSFFAWCCPSVTGHHSGRVICNDAESVSFELRVLRAYESVAGNEILFVKFKVCSWLSMLCFVLAAGRRDAPRVHSCPSQLLAGCHSCVLSHRNSLKRTYLHRIHRCPQADLVADVAHDLRVPTARIVFVDIKGTALSPALPGSLACVLSDVCFVDRPSFELGDRCSGMAAPLNSCLLGRCWRGRFAGDHPH
jgi:hypothetical protein